MLLRTGAQPDGAVAVPVVRVLLAAALALSPFAATVALAEPVPAEPAYTIERSVVTKVTAANGQVYRLFVSWPEGVPPATGWPVLYVLDGADHFATVTETARRFARAGARSGVVPGVVVAIDAGPLARRVFDYTPASPGWSIPAGAPASGLPTGGADAFLTLLDKQIEPLIARRWSVDPARRTLAGHSFGGLLALHALFTRPGVATRYAAVSPSLWFGGDVLSRGERGATVAGQQVLIAVGGNEGGPDAQAGSAAEALASRLSAGGATAAYLPLPGQDHGSSMLAAMGRIVTLAFGQKP